MHLHIHFAPVLGCRTLLEFAHCWMWMLDVVLLPETHIPYTYTHTRTKPCVILTLQVDVDAPDHDLFPLFRTAPYWEDQLRPGEMCAPASCLQPSFD